MRSPSGKREGVPGWSPGEWLKVRSQTQRGTPKENEKEHVERETPEGAEKGDDQLTGHERLRGKAELWT